MTMIKHIAVLMAAGFFLWNPWTNNYVDWVLSGPSQAGAKIAIGAAYALGAFGYGWIVTRVEVFQAYRKLPHALIGTALAVLWGSAAWLMGNDLIPMNEDVFYVLLLISVAVSVSIEVMMHTEARQGPGAAKIAAKVAKAHQPGGSVR